MGKAAFVFLPVMVVMAAGAGQAQRGDAAGRDRQSNTIEESWLFPTDSQLAWAVQQGYDGKQFGWKSVYPRYAGADEFFGMSTIKNCSRGLEIYVVGPLVRAAWVGNKARSKFEPLPDKPAYLPLRGQFMVEIQVLAGGDADYHWEIAIAQGDVLVRPTFQLKLDSELVSCGDGTSQWENFQNSVFDFNGSTYQLHWDSPMSLVVRWPDGGEDRFKLEVRKLLTREVSDLKLNHPSRH